MFVTLSFPKTRFSVTIPFDEETAIHKVPTGFVSVPPSGPAMPDTARAKSVLNKLLAP